MNNHRDEYLAWRMTYQSGEQAARSAFMEIMRLQQQLESINSGKTQMTISATCKIAALYLLGLILAINRELCWAIPGYKYLTGLMLRLLPVGVFVWLVRVDATAQQKYHY